MKFLIDGLKELNYSELVAVNGGCSGSCGGYISSSVTITKTSGTTLNPGISNPCSGFYPGHKSSSSSCSGIPTITRTCSYTSSTTVKIPEAINNNLDKTQNAYVYGVNDCDVWVEKVVSETGVNLESLWGSAKDLTVADHELKLEGKTTDAANVGWNVVLMTDSDIYSVNHCGIAKVENDGSVTFYQNTKSAGGPTIETYTSVKDFQAAYAYKDFDYLRIQN